MAIRGDMAMRCQRCGGPMMAETIIKLRRTFVGFREIRSQGAYCVSCKITVPVENQPLANRQSVEHRPGKFVFPWLGGRSRIPAWMPSRPQRVAIDTR